jgi:hypothetical protein
VRASWRRLRKRAGFSSAPLGYLTEFVKIYNFVGHHVHALYEASDHYVSPAMTWSFGLVVPVRVTVRNCVFPNWDCGISQVGLVSITLGSGFDAFSFIRGKGGGHNDKYVMPS